MWMPRLTGKFAMTLSTVLVQYGCNMDKLYASWKRPVKIIIGHLVMSIIKFFLYLFTNVLHIGFLKAWI